MKEETWKELLEPDELEWVLTQPPLTQSLVERDVLLVGTDHQHEWKGINSCEGQPHGKLLMVHMGDTFAYACADGERVTNEEMEEVDRIYKQYGHVGLICWAAKKRNEDPVIEYTEDPVYQKTWAALFGDLKVGANFCNTVDPRWSDGKLNLKEWTPLT